MGRTNKKLIAVVGATGQQKGAVVRALQAGGSKERPVSSALIEKQKNLILADADDLSLRGCS